MNFVERLVTFLKTLNPDAYEELCKELSLLEAWKQFLFNFALVFAVMLLLFLPAILVKGPAIEERLESFESLTLDGNVSAAAPIELVSSPRVVVDLSENRSIGKEKLLFTKEGISWKRWYFFGERFAPWENANDLTGLSDTAIVALLLFLAPSFAFWAGLFALLGYAVTILFSSLLAFLLPRIWRHKLSYASSLKLSLFAATIMMAVELWLLPFYWNWWIPLLAYFLFLSIGIALVGDRELGERRRRKGHEIFR